MTVGTTLFDPLVEAVSSEEFLRSVSSPRCGSYGDVTVQYGKGVRPTPRPLRSLVREEDDGGAGGGGRGEGGGEGEDDVVDCEVATGNRGGADGGAEKEEGKRTTTTRFRAYRFKPSLDDDMRRADLIVSHAGAGSIVEGLALCAEAAAEAAAAELPAGEETATTTPTTRKKLVVVINSRLMDDHQRELADAMEERGYLYVVSDPESLRNEEVLAAIEDFVPSPFPGGEVGVFAALLDEHMGFVPKGKKRV